MKIVFTGPPGAGKGTVADILEELVGLVHISTGELFRENIASGTPLGKAIEEIIAGGNLVDDKTTLLVLRERISRRDVKKNGYILDGFPRDLTQLNVLRSFETIDFVINFDLPDEEVIKRISGRLVAPSSGRTYHTIYNPPKVEGKDDVTGEDLIQRDDDKIEAVMRRLEVYRHLTVPVIEKYKDMKLLVNIKEDSMSPSEIASIVLEKIGY